MQIMEIIFDKLIAGWFSVYLITGIPYRFIYDNFRITSITGTWGFIGMILCHDIGYYWAHRSAHRVSALWAVHAVHHRSNEFNLSVGLSQGALRRWSEALFYAPLALFFPPELYFLLHPLAQMFGFFSHTQLVSDVGFLQYIFVTPALHRVHHASSPAKYIDKNYGEIFSFWDRLFGTYEDEMEQPVYGTVEPHHTWDPIEPNLTVWKKLIKKTHECNSIWKKVYCFLGPPGWNPANGEEYPIPDVTPYVAVKYDSHLPFQVQTYRFVHFLITALIGIVSLQVRSMSRSSSVHLTGKFNLSFKGLQKERFCVLHVDCGISSDILDVSTWQNGRQKPQHLLV
jgi:sterol desaturase/sphingolipid hydroxylase (fatty acid hydroxylase superfamily)